MFRFIINSLLFIFFFRIVIASKDFGVVMGKKDFKTTKSLLAVYNQQDADPSDGYHQAEFNLKTDLPSFNPDQSGVESIKCKKGSNGKRKITFNLKDKKAIKDVKEWPERVMLLISHKWKCFGKRSTQFFTATDRVIDESNLSATFAIMRCDYPYNSNDYELNINWVEGVNQSKNKTRRNLEERFGIPFPTINSSNKLGLNILFDSNNGRTSRPNIPIINDGNVRLLCSNCFTKGDATIAVKIRGNIVPPKLKEASISLDGNFLMNLDFTLDASKEKNKRLNRKNTSAKDFQIFSIGLGPFNIPGILNLGPSIDLVAAADATLETGGTLEFGGDLSLPNFSARASFKGDPSFDQSGFTPKVNVHNPDFDVEASATISASLKPQFAFGLSVLNGRVLRQKVGFELVGTLQNSFIFGNCENKKKPRLDSSLGGNVGFFANENNFPIFTFPTLPLLNKCL
ncbi:unnamed protein product [Rhizophagus irregularis]|uniref:DUF7223 domain-containing protein n=1 Tax=Rhizophagus irregularis TaxID=588596 RepID=A0A2I1EMT3_9GLOM|nr:hypothetical protein RhiirB3_526470 [Rhizophagus irregularis]CAB5190391.1 unnamed protein product [Rhizophagus irregularis]CAB5353519.1 unnamed protein product [Rhizophagus irregularis]